MLKKEAGIAERKLLARNERIQHLEAMLQDADRRLSAQNQKVEAQLQAVKERLDQARGWSSLNYRSEISFSEICPIAQKVPTSSSLSFGRIAKPLRGGGGAALSTTTASAGPSVTSNPLSRVQNEEAA